MVPSQDLVPRSGVQVSSNTRPHCPMAQPWSFEILAKRPISTGSGEYAVSVQTGPYAYQDGTFDGGLGNRGLCHPQLQQRRWDVVYHDRYGKWR